MLEETLKVDSLTEIGLRKKKNMVEKSMREGEYNKGFDRDAVSEAGHGHRRSKSSKFKNKHHNAYLNNSKENFGGPMLPSIAKSKAQINNSYMSNSYKDLMPPKKRSYSINNMKRHNIYSRDLHSPTVVTDK
jgi:hypothetical protein